MAKKPDPFYTQRVRDARALLKLDGVPLTPVQEALLASLFGSVPHPLRGNPYHLLHHMKVAAACVKAFSRAETIRTAAQSPELQDAWREVLDSVGLTQKCVEYGFEDLARRIVPKKLRDEQR